MVQLLSHHPILLSLWLGHENYFMSELLDDYKRAMKSQNTSFMNVIAGRLLDAGYEIEAEYLHNEIQFLTEEVFHKDNAPIIWRFKTIIGWK